MLKILLIAAIVATATAGTCKSTSCSYSSGHTHVYSKMLNDDGSANTSHERWHCQKSGSSGCACTCADALKCTLTHHHTSGYKRSFDHCEPAAAPVAKCARIGETASYAISDDVFFKGAYIQLGINRHGYCGTKSRVPVERGWVRHRHINTGLCAVADPHKDGWNRKRAGAKHNFHGPFTIPGSPQEAWVLGYYHYGTRKVSDFGRAGFRDPNGFRCTIVDQTNAAAGQLKATSTCSNSAISVTQVVGFAACDISVNWDVTVAARTGGITNVVYLRNLDPDNDQDKSGSYMTKNTILGQRTTGSKYSFVSATSLMGSDSFFGLFSRDSRSRVRYGGFNNDDPWTNEFNKATSTYRTGAATNCDCAIDIQFRLGNIGSGSSTKFNMKWVFAKDEDLSKL
jgi:hypothetical protein